MQARLLAALLGTIALFTLLALGAPGCAGNGGNHTAQDLEGAIPGGVLAPGTLGLPGLPDDSGAPRAVSAESEETLTGDLTYLESLDAETVGEALRLESAESVPLQWAVYQLPVGASTPVRYQANITVTAGRYWLAVANYDTGLWEFSSPLTIGQPQFSLTQAQKYVSPGQYFYLCVITAEFNGTFGDSTVNSVTLVVNDEAVPTFSIGGTITDGGSAAPLEGASVQLEPGGLMTLTDSAGEYLFSDLEAGDYTITPELFGYVLDPAFREVTLSDSDATGQDFSGTAQQVLYGEVLESGVTPVSGVELHLVALNANGSINSAGYRMATTDDAGHYQFDNMTAGNYRLVPQKDSWVFAPNIVEFTYSGPTPQGFTATAVSLPATVTFDDHMLQWLFEPNCMQCHDSAKAGSARNFAPGTVNYDTYGGTTVSKKTSGNTRVQNDSMPPATLHFKTTPFQKALYQKWLDGGFAEN